MWDDAPGSERSIQPSHHPEHTQPAQVFASLVHGKELREVGVDNGNRASNTKKNTVTEMLHYKDIFHQQQQTIVTMVTKFFCIQAMMGSKEAYYSSTMHAY